MITWLMTVAIVLLSLATTHFDRISRSYHETRSRLRRQVTANLELENQFVFVLADLHAASLQDRTLDELLRATGYKTPFKPGTPP